MNCLPHRRQTAKNPARHWHGACGKLDQNIATSKSTTCNTIEKDLAQTNAEPPHHLQGNRSSPPSLGRILEDPPEKSNKSAFRYGPSAQPRTINHSLSTAKYRQGEICIVIQPSTIKKQHSQAQPSTGKQSEASKHSQAQTSTSNHSQAQSSKAQHSQARSYKIASRAPRRQTRG